MAKPDAKTVTGLALSLGEPVNGESHGVLIFLSGWDNMFHVITEDPEQGELWFKHEFVGVTGVETLTRMPKAPVETVAQYFGRICKELA